MRLSTFTTKQVIKFIKTIDIGTVMGKLKCILCTPFSCCVSGNAAYDGEIKEHRRTQLTGLDQAIRSINLGQNNYSPQIDDPNAEDIKPEKIGKREEHNFHYQSATLEPYNNQ